MATKEKRVGRVRQRSGPETLQRILDAATHEFGARGLAGAQIETIAREAGIAKQLIYYYYGSREGLYEAMMQDLNARHIARVAGVDFDALPALEGLNQFFNCFFDNYEQTPDLVSLALDFNFHGSVHLRVTDTQRLPMRIYDMLIDRAIAEGVVAADIDRQSCFSFAMLIVNGCFLDRDRAWGFGPMAGALAEKRVKALRAIQAIFTAGSAPAA